jgi:hypothetical protein
MSTEDEKITAVQKILGEPVFIAFSDEVNRIRRNLLVITSIILTYKHSGTDITRFTLFGVDFEHLKPTFVDTCLFLLLQDLRTTVTQVTILRGEFNFSFIYSASNFTFS